MVAVPTTPPNPRTMPTLPAATAKRATAGTMPSASWNRCHQVKRFGRGRSAPGSSRSYSAGTVDGLGAGTGEVEPRVCSAIATSVKSSSSSAASCRVSQAPSAWFTQPWMTPTHELMFCAVAAPSLNSSRRAAHDATPIRCSNDESSFTVVESPYTRRNASYSALAACKTRCRPALLTRRVAVSTRTRCV